MIAARAVVTERGGSTSHAAVVTRALGRPSVVGVGEGVTGAWAGRELTVDGSAGVVYAGRLPTEAVRLDDVPGLAELVAWARELRPGASAEPAPADEHGLPVEHPAVVLLRLVEERNPSEEER
jgi:pyruvate,orthophosphate dikinase